MSGPLHRHDPPARLHELRERGWCAFEALFSPSESARMERMLLDFVDGLAPERLAGFGATIFALAARAPKMRSFYRELPIVPFLEDALEGPIALRRTGARVSGRTSHERIIWHHHHGWSAETLTTRARFERLLFICYLQGTDRAHGPLVVRPRAFTDPLEEVQGDPFAPLPGEVHLEYPPGTVVVMDAPVLHSALRGTGDALRTIWGAHCQPRDLLRPHPEDDPGFERARVGFRHTTFRWGLRDQRKWLRDANAAPLPERSAY
jgi:hypothetical protein